MSDRTREMFEAAFPRPDGIKWGGRGYVSEHRKDATDALHYTNAYLAFNYGLVNAVNEQIVGVMHRNHILEKENKDLRIANNMLRNAR